MTNKQEQITLRVIPDLIRDLMAAINVDLLSAYDQGCRISKDPETNSG